MNVLYIEGNQIEELKSKYQSIDLLLIDNIQAIMGKEDIGKEYISICKTLLENGAQIVIASNKELKGTNMYNELSSISDWSLLADIKKYK